MGRLNLLLDSHVLLWWLEDHARLSAKTHILIETAVVVWASSVSAWELEVKRLRGLLKVPLDLAFAFDASGLRPLPVTVAHALAAARLPQHHRDPFDRILVAQAATEGLTLVTSDQQLASYDVPIILA